MKTRLSIVLMMLVICVVRPVTAQTGTTESAVAEDSKRVKECACASSEEVKKKLEPYIVAARARIDAKDVDTLTRFDQAQRSFKGYSEEMCRVTYSKWLKENSRFKFYYCCQERLAQQYALELWIDFIKYSDNTEPPLSKPALQSCEDE